MHTELTLMTFPNLESQWATDTYRNLSQHSFSMWLKDSQNHTLNLIMQKMNKYWLNSSEQAHYALWHKGTYMLQLFCYRIRNWVLSFSPWCFLYYIFLPAVIQNKCQIELHFIFKFWLLFLLEIFQGEFWSLKMGDKIICGKTSMTMNVFNAALLQY